MEGSVRNSIKGGIRYEKETGRGYVCRIDVNSNRNEHELSDRARHLLFPGHDREEHRSFSKLPVALYR